MKPFDSYKNSSTAGRSFFVPMLLVAIALHGIFLLIPIAGDTDSPEVLEDEEEETQAESQPFASPQLTPSLPEEGEEAVEPEQPTAARNLAPQQTERLQATAEAARGYYADSARTYYSAPGYSSQQTAPQPQQTAPQPQQRATRQSPPSPAPETSQAASAPASPAPSPEEERTVPTFSQEQSSDVASAPSTSQPPEPSPQPQSNSTTSETFLQNFPYYLGSLINSGGVLKPKFNEFNYIYYTGDNLKEVADSFKKQLENRDFSVTTETDEENFKVYEVKKGDVTRFLHLISQGGKTAIFLDSEARSLEELEREEAGEEQPAIVQFYDMFKQKIRENEELSLQELQPSDLDRFPESDTLRKVNAEPDELELEVDKLLLDRLEAITSPSQPMSPEELASTIETQLSEGEEEFQLEEVGDYGGGKLYEVTRDEFKVYLILVSTEGEEASRTGMLLSKTDPRQ
jgi:hypothetical protein